MTQDAGALLKLADCPFCGCEGQKFKDFWDSGQIDCFGCKDCGVAFERADEWNRREAAAVPVAWRWRIKDGDGNVSAWEISSTDPKISKMVLHDCEPLYAAPGPRSEVLSRDALAVDPRLTTIAENATKRIARAERLDNVSAKEIYRIILDVMISACLALESKAFADAILSGDAAQEPKRTPLDLEPAELNTLATEAFRCAAQASGDSGADAMIGEIEKRFPDWKGFRDLVDCIEPPLIAGVDCIDVTLHRLRWRST